jgi:hypothetical protein
MPPRPHASTSRVAFAPTIALLLALSATLVVCLAPVPAAAAPAQPVFPRLAIWWPDFKTQSAAQLAGLDWIALQPTDADHIAELRAANPDMIVLGSTNARELNYVLGAYDNPRNVELRSASTDWILTQVGSTLRADVTAQATSIPVADASRFAKGEMVLVDDELMHVESVGTSNLTVARGPVNPASAHASGARIASVVSAWPGSITFDVSGTCPKADMGHGMETWNDWNVRRGRVAADSADWDGLFVDCLETDPTWMVTNGIVRTIDPTRSNVPVTDAYKAFDASWAAGAAAYGTALRAACGDRIIIGNGNVRNFDLNGTVFEDFPYADFSLSRWDLVFAGWNWAYPHASYPEWCAKAATPNLTLVQTYGAANDYRMMRYGLCSALMNDGYFMMSGDAHSTSGLYWFDEYDDAGAGQGYLGHPSSEATTVGGAWRRDFENGIALVNPTGSTVTVAVGAGFRKIKGTQDPKVNDGTFVTSVTIPARDGVVLLRAPTVVLQASTTVLAYGLATTLHVTVAPAQAVEVTGEYRAAGDTRWKRLATVTVDAAGEAWLTRRPHVTTEYRAVLAGSGAVSKTVKVGVRPSTTLKASKTSVRRGGHVVLSGTVSRAARALVRLQRFKAGRWTTVRRLSASSKGAYRTTVSPSKRGTLVYRIRVLPAVSHLSAVSAVVRITVR